MLRTVLALSSMRDNRGLSEFLPTDWRILDAARRIMRAHGYNGMGLTHAFFTVCAVVDQARCAVAGAAPELRSAFR